MTYGYNGRIDQIYERHDSMIFGHTIVFVDEPSLNVVSVNTFADHRVISIKAMDLPKFSLFTDYHSHSLQQVRYGTNFPFAETGGKGVVWSMEIKNVLTLVWFPEEWTIGYEKGKGYTPERLRFWIYHTFLPLIFQMEDVYHILHTGCVEIEDKAVLLTAPSFGGKSTLTDYFLERGHRLLSDDTLAVEQQYDGSYRAVASWPFRRPFRKAETLGTETDAFVTEPLEIAAIFYLEKAEEAAAVETIPVQGIEKFKIIHHATFIPLAFLKEKIFAFHTAFARSVMVKRITLPWNTERLNEVYETIIAEVRK